MDEENDNSSSLFAYVDEDAEDVVFEPAKPVLVRRIDSQRTSRLDEGVEVVGDILDHGVLDKLDVAHK